MLNKRLKELRKETGLSQYEVAKRIGFSRGQLANYEQGQREPDYQSLEKLADFYDCSTDYLLGRTYMRNYNKDSSEIDLLVDVEKGLKVEELQKKYNLTIDGEVATKEEIEGAIAFIRSLRGMKN